MRKEYIHKDTKPIEYWFNVIAQMMMSAAVLGLGFWLLDDLPAFLGTLKSAQCFLLIHHRKDAKPRSSGVLLPEDNHGASKPEGLKSQLQS